MFSSAEPALPENSPIESISINYPDRNIEIAGYGMNWIWLFFILSMVAGFIFKELVGDQDMKRLCGAGALARLRASAIKLWEGVAALQCIASAGFSRAGAPAPHGSC